MLSSILVFLFLVIVLLNVPQVQSMLKDIAVKYLNKKLQTTVQLDHLAIDFPSSVAIDSFYMADRGGDTLVYSGHLFVQIDMLGLLSGDVRIDSIRLDNFSANVSRTLPDTAFNFNYILEAFGATGEDTTTEDTASSGTFTLGAIDLSNIRLRYNDVVTGMHGKFILGKFVTRFNAFNLDSMRFDLDSIKLADVFADFIQKQPLVTNTTDHAQPEAEDSAAATKMPELAFAGLSIHKMKVNYQDQPGEMEGKVALDTFLLIPDKIDLNEQDIRLKKLLLDHSQIAFSMKSAPEEPEAASPPEAEDTLNKASTGSWRISLNELQLLQNHFKFDDEGQPRQKRGIDYSHLDVTHFVLLASDLLYTVDSSHVALHQLTFQEQSGFDLKQLQTDATYTSKGATLDDLLLQTANSRLSRKLAINYKSLEALSESPGDLGLDVVIDSAQIAMKDVFYFQPELADNAYLSGLADSPVYLRGILQGKLNDLAIDSLLLKVSSSTSLAMNAHLKNVIEPDRAFFDVNIDRLNTGRKDLQALLPDSLLPDNIRIPTRFSLTGDYKGSLQSFNTRVQFRSTDGNGRLRAKVKNLSDSVNAAYDAAIALDRIRLDHILKNDTLYGPVSLDMSVQGQGLTTQSMRAGLRGRIKQVVLQGYNYQNLILKGRVENQKGRITADMHDPNLDFSLVSNADLSDSIPAIVLNLDLKNADLYALHVAEDSLKIQGTINADIPQLDLEKPNGEITLENWNIVNKTQNIRIDSVFLKAVTSDTLNSIQLRSPLVSADISGDYKLDETGPLLQYFKNEYLGEDSAAAVDVDTLSDWDMRLDIRLLRSGIWQQILPSLTAFDGAQIQGVIQSKPKALLLNGDFAPFVFDDIAVDSILMDVYSKGDQLNYALAGHAIHSSSINIPHFYLNGHLDSSAVLVNLKTLDETKKVRYHLTGDLAMNGENYKFSLLHDSLMLNYNYWNVPTDNYVAYSPEGLIVHHVKLQNGNQYLSVNSEEESVKKPLKIVFHDFNITTLTQLVMNDSLSIKGVINGDATVDSLMTNPLFVSDLRLEQLAFNEVPLGAILLKVDNKLKNTYSVNMALTGNGNDLKVNGAYYTQDAGSFDFDVDINALPMKTVEAFSFDQLSNSTGKLTGDLTLKGTTEAPQINGAVHFQDVGFKVTQLNNSFKLENESIAFDPSGIHLNQFTILDSANNKAVIDGDVLTEKYQHFAFDLSLKADNYRVLNVPKNLGETYYGQLYISTDATITGDENLPEINMNVNVEDHSDLTVVMIDENPEVVSSSGVVEFFDPDAPVDSAQLLTADSARYTSTLSGIDLSANIAIDTNAVLNLVIDPMNGDNLSVKGQANLNFTIDPGGKMSLTGRYDIINGHYNMSFQGLIKREFDILRGSYIIWKGDPTSADMDITARYSVEAPALDLVQDQLSDVSETTKNTYKQELPFYVLLKLQGELMEPEIHFELDMPQEARQAFGGAIYTRIKQINTQPSEVNKQTLGLLVLGHFIADNPFETAGGGGVEQMVRESASKILSQQLNRLAGNLIEGVDLSFDLESSQDYSSGTAENQTNLNVGLSKSLFNDRTTIYVGGNIPLEGNSKQKASQIVGDVAVEYKLSKDGRYRLRAFRKNEYQGVIEGQYIETGLSFIIVMDYDEFKELFHRASKFSEDE